MAWNRYYIFVKTPMMTNIGEILIRLNLGLYKPIQEVTLLESNKPETLFTGFYNGSLLIVHPDLSFQFSNDIPIQTEKLFVETFPDCEIAALVENSTVGLFSYAIIQSGTKIRMKDGSDGEVYHDYGDLLPDEREVLSEKISEDEEIEEMRDDGLNDKEIDAMIKFKASWRVPNRLTKRYLGETVGSIDSDKVVLTMYE